MTEIRNLTRNGETFYPLTHEKAVIGMEDFKETITEQIENYRPIEITGDVTNAPDEEDITSDSNNLLKFKNRNNLYGLGKVILRRGSSFASQVTLANTIYVVQYNFDLGNARINMPNGSILLFEGGTLSNGTLVCADQYDVRLVYYQDQSEILSEVTLEGNFIHKACDKDTNTVIDADGTSLIKNGNILSIKDGGVTGAKLNSGIVNTDDLSIVNNKIQLADRPNTDGMGKIILRKDLSFASQLTQQNTMYVIRYDYTLTGDVTIPSNCVLEFEGGSISGAYTITGNNTGIKASLVKIFNTNITLAGIWNVAEAYPEWFGAVGDGVTDDTDAIQKILNIATNVCLKNTYLVTNTLNQGVARNIYGGAKIINHNTHRSLLPVYTNNTTIKDIYFDSDNAGRGAIAITASNVIVENCKFSHFKVLPDTYGGNNGQIFIEGGENNIITKCQFVDNGYNYTTATEELNRCISMHGDAKYISINGNIFNRVNQGIIIWTDNDSINITNNIFNSVVDNAIYAFGKHVNITGNTFSNGNDETIVITGGDYVITSNIFNNEGNSCISFVGDVNSLLATNNIMNSDDLESVHKTKFCTLRTNTAYEVKSLIMKNNQINAVNGINYQIYVNVTDHCDISDNYIVGSLSGSANGIIRLYDYSKYMKISHNNMINTGEASSSTSIVYFSGNTRKSNSKALISMNFNIGLRESNANIGDFGCFEAPMNQRNTKIPTTGIILLSTVEPVIDAPDWSICFNTSANTSPIGWKMINGSWIAFG